MSGYGSNAKLAAYRSVSAYGAVTAATDPHRLILMLMDGAIERLTTAQGCLERGEIVQKTKLLHSCITIVAELRGSLNMKDGGDVAGNLNKLYGYMIRRLLLANAANDPRYLSEVRQLLNDIRGAWTAIGPSVRSNAAAPPAAR